MICPKCNFNNAENSSFCMNCGTALANNNQTVQAPQPQQPVVPTQPVQPQQAPQPTKKNHKGLIIGMVVVLLIGLFVFIKTISSSNSTKKYQLENNPSYNNENTNNDVIEENTDDSPVEPGDVSIAILGQVSHGKTPLTSAITKYYGTFVPEDVIDRAEYKEFDNIVLSYATVQCKTENRNYTIYDYPGYSDVVKSFIIGATPVDGAILVVSAIDGPQAQTNSNVYMLHRLGIKRVSVFINDRYKEPEDQINKVIEDTKKLLKEQGFNARKTPFIIGSTKDALNGTPEGEKSIKDLMTQTDNWISPLKDEEQEVSTNEIITQTYFLTDIESGVKKLINVDENPSLKFELEFDNKTVSATMEPPVGTTYILQGDNLACTFHLDQKTKIKKGEHFKIKENGHLIFSGIVLETK